MAVRLRPPRLPLWSQLNGKLSASEADHGGSTPSSAVLSSTYAEPNSQSLSTLQATSILEHEGFRVVREEKMLMANKTLFKSLVGKLVPAANARNEEHAPAYALTP